MATVYAGTFAASLVAPVARRYHAHARRRSKISAAFSVPAGDGVFPRGVARLSRRKRPIDALPGSDARLAAPLPRAAQRSPAGTADRPSGG